MSASPGYQQCRGSRLRREKAETKNQKQAFDPHLEADTDQLTLASNALYTAHVHRKRDRKERRASQPTAALLKQRTDSSTAARFSIYLRRRFCPDALLTIFNLRPPPPSLQAAQKRQRRGRASAALPWRHNERPWGEKCYHNTVGKKQQMCPRRAVFTELFHSLHQLLITDFNKYIKPTKYIFLKAQLNSECDGGSLTENCFLANTFQKR